MTDKKLQVLFFSLFIIVFFTAPINSREKYTTSSVATSNSYSYYAVEHKINNIVIMIQNNGRSGDYFYNTKITDYYTGAELWIECEYPKDSWIKYYQYLNLWVGAIDREDTLVSTGLGYEKWFYEFDEFYPSPKNDGKIQRLSSLPMDPYYSEDAVSELDHIVSYVDTVIGNIYSNYDHRYHKPMNIEVTQKNYGWSYSYAEDIILFEYTITNIGDRKLRNLYYGINVTARTGLALNPSVDGNTSGFIKDFPNKETSCKYNDTINLVWQASYDGAPYQGEFIDYIVWEDDNVFKSATDIAGIAFLDKSKDEKNLSFNWWESISLDFGPQTIEKYKYFGYHNDGVPTSDKLSYHLLSNGEIDYDPIYTSHIRKSDPTWRYPDRNVATLISEYGVHINYLLSAGPLDLTPGASFTFPFAVVGGENFHLDPENKNKYYASDPEAYYANVDFSDLAQNAMYASWIYDNPGVDTDGDGFYGKYRICAIDSIETESGWVTSKADTTFYEGDGIPDWRAAGPPPAPDFWLEPQNNSIRIRFNGERSETEKDFMTGVVDFEGYHLWMGRDERETSLSIIASYDLYNFDKYVFNKNLLPDPNFQLHDNPLTLEQLRCLYGNGCDDSLFNPLDYVRHDPYIHPDYPDSIFIFLPHNNNTSELGVTTPITKVYPNAVNPNSIHPDSLTDIHYTEDGYFKYYEYQFYVTNLLPTVPYYFNVTSFDMGSAQTGLNPLESSKTLNIQFTYPLSPGTSLTDNNRKVYIYPNPYIINAGYRDKRYEGRNKDYLPPDKVRAIHFNNLPAKCEISIFSFDGDLVRRMTHDFDENDPNKLQHEWNLVTKNRQLVVSGIYYWTVEDSNGQVQMGKLAIIM